MGHDGDTDTTTEPDTASGAGSGGAGPRLFTVGHGTSTREELTSLLAGAGIEQVVDVRRFPGSRKHPDMGRDVLAQWLPEAGIDYVWEENLGGRRHIPAGQPQPDTWWKVEAFRAYASYTRTPEFGLGLKRLLGYIALRRTTVMCSESVWWRCHRRLISDVMMLSRHGEVSHLMPGGRVSPHRLAAGARLDGDSIFWDLPQEQ